MTTLLKQSTRQIDIEIGARIRDFRHIRGVTQERLGDALGVSFQQIQKYEKGTNRIATSTLVKICQLLEIAPTDVIGRYFDGAVASVGLMNSVADENKALKAKLARIRAIFGDLDAAHAVDDMPVTTSFGRVLRETEARHQ
jgi:transcriptional regulator with XRE-family HTH domain